MEDKGTRRWFWGAAVLVTLLVLSVGIIVYQKQILDQTRLLKQDAAAAVEARADALSAWTQRRIAELRVMAGTPAIRSGESGAALEYLAGERSRHADHPQLGLLGLDGIMTFPDGTTASVASDSSFEIHGGGMLAGPLNGPDGASGIVMAAPYEDAGGQTAGAVGSFVPLGRIFSTYYDFELAEEQELFFISGGTMYRLNAEGAAVPDERYLPGLDLSEGAASRTAAVESEDGGDNLLVLAAVEGTPWQLAAAVPERLLLAAAHNGWQRIAGWTAVLEAVLLLLLYGYRRIADRLGRLKLRLVEMSQAARLDLLTALPNRVHLRETLNALIRSYPFSKQRLIGVVLIDLDRFKNINDTLGHSAGDQYLVATAERLGGGLRPGQRLYRLGGDEFVLLLESLQDAEEGKAEARRLLDLLRAPIRLKGQEFIISGSAGISFYPLHANNGSELLRNADLAMYYAKQRGGGCLVCYDSSMVEKTTRDLQIEQHLRRAVAEGELSLVYQPIQSIGDERDGLCVEALLRWHSRALGTVRPDLFIPIAESTGLIVEIGGWVLRQACAQMGLWRRRGLPIDRVSVNLSIIQLEQPGFVDKVRAILEETGCEPQALMLELTESAVISRLDLIAETISGLSDLGITIALDDFGTGYSSLSVLHQLNVHVLKIDRSFISRIRESGKDEALVNMILSIARLLGLASIAEGVETAEQLTLLRRMQCTHAQGYLLSKPLAAPDLERYAMRHTGWNPA